MYKKINCEYDIVIGGDFDWQCPRCEKISRKPLLNAQHNCPWCFYPIDLNRLEKILIDFNPIKGN